MIVETMGRYAGWIALHAGVAGGADVILIPELEYELDEIVQVCRERENGGQRFTIIAVAEGAKPKGGERAVDKIVEDSPDPVRLGGIGHVLEHQLQDKVSSEVRTTILGHMQRGGTPTAFDRNLSTIYGAYAATLVAEGTFGQMVAIDDGHLSSVDLGAVAGKTRTVPLTASLLVSGFGLGTSFGVSDLNERLGPLDGAAVVA
jgi:6-phosphofructokinase 1